MKKTTLLIFSFILWGIVGILSYPDIEKLMMVTTILILLNVIQLNDDGG